MIWKVAPRVPVPSKLIEEPEEAVGLFWPEVGFSWKPAKVSARLRKALVWARVGLSMICSAVRACLISALVVLMGGRSAVTVTTSATRGSRTRSTTMVSFRRTSTLSRTAVPNPAREARTW